MQNVLPGSNAGMETSTPLDNSTVNNVQFHSNYTHQSDAIPQVIRIPRYCTVDSLTQFLHTTGLMPGLFGSHKSGSS